jgi:hypothetical protein
VGRIVLEVGRHGVELVLEGLFYAGLTLGVNRNMGLSREGSHVWVALVVFKQLLALCCLELDWLGLSGA